MKLVIIGAGTSAFSLVKNLRALKVPVDITIITKCNGEEYYKPNLSKWLTTGKRTEDLVIRSRSRCEKDYKINIIHSTEVIGVDKKNKKVKTSNGEILFFDNLVFALGAKSNLKVDCSYDRVFDLHSLSSYMDLSKTLGQGNRYGILGNGMVGCEIASQLAASGERVALFGRSKFPCGRYLPQTISEAIHNIMSSEGVEFKEVCTKSEISVHRFGVNIVNEAKIESCDYLIDCTGSSPNVQLAKSGGIKTNIGIATDSTLETSVEGIFAIGDCAEINGEVHQYIQPSIISARALSKSLSGKKTAVKINPFPISVNIHKASVKIFSFEKSENWQVSRQGDNIFALNYSIAGLCTGYVALNCDKKIIAELSSKVVADVA